jgi:hypothetical protein
MLAEGKKDMPIVRAMSEWQKSKEFKDWTWGIADVDVESHNVDSRSAFLVKAAEEVMRRDTEIA